jgi:vesicle coat complex subunit
MPEQDDLQEVMAKLDSLITPPEMPELSRFDEEINAMAEKMRKEAIEKLGYIEAEIIEVAKNVMKETLSLMHEESKTCTDKVIKAKSEFQDISRNIVKELHETGRASIDSFYDELISINKNIKGVRNSLNGFEQQIARIRESVSSIQIKSDKNLIPEFKGDITKLRDSVIAEIERKVRSVMEEMEIKFSHRIKELESIVIKKEVQKELIKKGEGEPEHFIDNIIKNGEAPAHDAGLIRTPEDLQKIGERKGNLDELLK